MLLLGISRFPRQQTERLSVVLRLRVSLQPSITRSKCLTKGFQERIVEVDLRIEWVKFETPNCSTKLLIVLTTDYSDFINESEI
jgi:hypothetical protein